MIRIALSVAAMLLAPLATLPSQQPAPRKLGVFLWHDSSNDYATLAGIRLAMTRGGAAHEWIERQANSDPEKAQAALRELREARCDLIFALGTQAALLAKEAIRDVPVVFAAVSDPVASGVVPGWSGSGSNLCGASNWIGPANVLEVFRLAVPGLRRLGVVRSRETGVVSAAEVATMRAHLAAGADPGLQLHEEVADGKTDIATAVRKLVATGVDAIWIPIDITIYRDIAEVQRGLDDRAVPLLTTAAASVRNGAHVGAVVDYELHGRRAARLALEVLDGGKSPGNLPVDRMQSKLVTVNLASARCAGVELPLSLLAVADTLLDTEAR